MGFVTTRDSPVKSDTEFLMLEVEMVIVLLFSHGSLRVERFSERFHKNTVKTRIQNPNSKPNPKE